MSEDVNIVIADDSATNKHGTTTEIGRKGQTEWRARWVGRESTYQEIQTTDPRVVVVRLEPNMQQALALVRRIYRDFPQVAILAGTIKDSHEIARQAVQCGADECLTGMIDRASLMSAFERIARRRGWDDAYADSRVITVFGAKGGVGCTTIATNLATNIALQSEEKTVVIVDLCMQFGNVLAFMKVQANDTLPEVVRNKDRLDSSLIQTCLAKHSSGALVVPSPSDITGIDGEISPEDLGETLDVLKSLADYVIVDCDHSFSDLNITALDKADTILLVTDMLIPSIHNTKQCLGIFKQVEYNQDKTKLILNRYYKKCEIKPGDLEKSLDHPVFKIISDDPPTVVQAINQGVALAEISTKSRTTKNVQELTELLVGDATSVKKKRSSVLSVLGRSEGSSSNAKANNQPPGKGGTIASVRAASVL